MVKRHAFLENLDAYMDDEARRGELVQIIRPLLAGLVECARGAPDHAGAVICADQAAGDLAETFLQCIKEGMRAGAEWAGVRCGFAGTGPQGGLDTGIDQEAAFLAQAFHQGERRARETIAAAQSMKAGEVGGHS